MVISNPTQLEIKLQSLALKIEDLTARAQQVQSTTLALAA